MQEGGRRVVVVNGGRKGRKGEAEGARYGRDLADRGRWAVEMASTPLFDKPGAFWISERGSHVID